MATHRGDLNFEVIFTAPPYVLLAEDHPLADRESVSLAQLVDEPLILFSLSPGGDYFLSLFHTEQLEPRVRYRATSFELVRSLVAKSVSGTNTQPADPDLGELTKAVASPRDRSTEIIRALPSAR